MRRSILLAFVSIFAVASVALAATGDQEPKATLVQAVSRTNTASSLRYVMEIAVRHRHSPTTKLHIHGARGTGAFFIHVRMYSSVGDGGPAAVPGPQQSAFVDGPFLYEGSPNGVALSGKIRWLRIPIARVGQAASEVTAIRNLSPAPLLRILDEWSHARTRAVNGMFHGTVAYDDPIVLTALGGMAGGVEFRDVVFTARIGNDGYVHSIRVTGATADGSRTVTVTAQLFGFGLPVRVNPPREGTFMDQKLLGLAE